VSGDDVVNEVVDNTFFRSPAITKYMYKDEKTSGNENSKITFKMNLTRRMLLLTLITAGSLSSQVSALAPVEIKGYKFFDSETGREVVVRGIDYYPRPNSGNLNRNSLDLFTEKHRHIWERDIPYLAELGVNAVRLYAVDAMENHDAFM
jgi:pullulanase/glycogen debranching enzyme